MLPLTPVVKAPWPAPPEPMLPPHASQEIPEIVDRESPLVHPRHSSEAIQRADGERAPGVSGFPGWVSGTLRSRERIHCIGPSLIWNLLRLAH